MPSMSLARCLHAHRGKIVVLALAVAAVVAVARAAGPGGKAGETASAPRVPSDEREVLERVPVRAAAGEVARLRKRLDAEPANLEIAVELAQLELEESRAHGDPRGLGRAEAALAPWWPERDAPPKVLLLRATIRGRLQDFDGALADLDRLVAVRPDDAQGWLARSAVLTVRGRYTEARESCAPLTRLGSPLVAGACTAPVDSLTGHARDAYLRLHDLYAEAAPTLATDGERAFVLAILAEVAIRVGDDVAAERDFETALAASPSEALAATVAK